MARPYRPPIWQAADAAAQRHAIRLQTRDAAGLPSVELRHPLTTDAATTGRGILFPSIDLE